MSDYIEGKRPVLEALRGGVPLEQVFLADNLKRDGLVLDVLRKASAAGVPVRTVPRKRLDEMSTLGERDSHQGVIAQVQPYRYRSGEDALVLGDADAARRQSEQTGAYALLVVLDHLTDAGNLGAIIRSAEVLGASAVVIPARRAAQVTAATFKSSAGAVVSLPIARVSNIVQFLDACKNDGWWVACASEHAADDIARTNLKGKIVLVLGNEADGISRLVLDHADLLVRIPQAGKVESLSVAQAASVCCYEWLRQNRA